MGPSIRSENWIAAFAGMAMLAAGSVLASETTFELRIDNPARLPPEQLESILEDCRAWAKRVYDYHGLTHPKPVTIKLSLEARIGFYRRGTVILPVSDDRWTMLDDFVHELSHHATGHDSSFFFKEGIAVHTLEKLFGDAGRVPLPWPQFGHSTDAWVALYQERGKLMPLAMALDWPHYMGGTPEKDFRSWQIYNQAGSFVGWYIKRYGFEAFRRAFTARKPEGDLAELEKAWLADVRASKPPRFDPVKALGNKPRYRRYAARLEE